MNPMPNTVNAIVKFTINSCTTDIIAEIVSAPEGALSKTFPIPPTTLPELSHIETFKKLVMLSKKEAKHKKIIGELWVAEPSVQNWFFGETLEVLYQSEKIRIRISKKELLHIYMSLLKSRNMPMCIMFLKDNIFLETLIKEIAEDLKQREAFITTLLASSTKGENVHIHTVLQYFPRDFLEQIKTTKENLLEKGKTPFRLAQIEILDLILQGKPYSESVRRKRGQPLMTDPIQTEAVLGQKRVQLSKDLPPTKAPKRTTKQKQPVYSAKFFNGTLNISWKSSALTALTAINTSDETQNIQKEGVQGSEEISVTPTRSNNPQSIDQNILPNMRDIIPCLVDSDDEGLNAFSKRSSL